MTTKPRYVFGPVPSRRLGRSLGVDLIPPKTCTFDCVYCQVGRTTAKTVTREAYVPADAVIEELSRKIKDGSRPDYVTFAGSGEPTLHADLAEIIAAVKAISDVPIAILTNGSLLSNPEVRAACARADLVVPSLDAGDEETFRRINRPHESIRFDVLIEGLALFRSEFAGRLALEVFLIEGMNADEASVQGIKNLCDHIRPDVIQLNTAVRPTAEAGISAVSPDKLHTLCRTFGDRAEVIAHFRAKDEGRSAAQREDVLAMLRRRPCTAEDLAGGLGVHAGEVAKIVGQLTTDGLIIQERRDGQIYFCAEPADDGPEGTD